MENALVKRMMDDLAVPTFLPDEVVRDEGEQDVVVEVVVKGEVVAVREEGDE